MSFLTCTTARQQLCGQLKERLPQSISLPGDPVGTSERARNDDAFLGTIALSDMSSRPLDGLQRATPVGVVRTQS
jgi:hypothetical protein